MAIDVGAACSDRSDILGNYTAIGIDNPANATGTIDYICIFATNMQMSNVEVASFIDEGSNILSTNGVVSLANPSVGENIYNAPGDFTAFNISVGEYIGIVGRYLEATATGGGGMWYKTGDNIPASSVTFSWIDGWALSLYATGTESAPPSIFIPQIIMF